MGLFDFLGGSSEPEQEIPEEVIAEGNLEELERLLSEGKDPNLPYGGGGLTPLLLAASNGNLDAVRLLLDKGADPNKGGGMYDFAPLAMASAVEVLDLLLERGAEVDRVDDRGETALLNAARNTQELAVKRLIEAGADVNLVSSRTGDSPLHVGAWGTSSSSYVDSELGEGMCDKEYIVTALLEAGARWFTNDDGETAWHSAAKAYVTQSVFTALDDAALGEEQDTDFLARIQGAQDYKGDTFMHIVAEHNVNDYDLIETYNSLLSVTNSEGKTPVQVAESRGFEDWVETANEILEEMALMEGD